MMAARGLLEEAAIDLVGPHENLHRRRVAGLMRRRGVDEARMPISTGGGLPRLAPCRNRPFRNRQSEGRRGGKTAFRCAHARRGVADCLRDRCNRMRRRSRSRLYERHVIPPQMRRALQVLEVEAPSSPACRRDRRPAARLLIDLDQSVIGFAARILPVEGCQHPDGKARQHRVPQDSEEGALELPQTPTPTRRGV